MLSMAEPFSETCLKDNDNQERINYCFCAFGEMIRNIKYAHLQYREDLLHNKRRVDLSPAQEQKCIEESKR